MEAAVTMSRDVGKKPACDALGVSRATFYRRSEPALKPGAARPAPPLALTAEERTAVLEVLHSERFRDVAPMEVYATLRLPRSVCASVSAGPGSPSREASCRRCPGCRWPNSSN